MLVGEQRVMAFRTRQPIWDADRTAQQAGFVGSQERLLEQLARVRRVSVARPTGTAGRFRVSTQLEDIDPDIAPLLPALGVAA